jgi:hypothetical protein
MVVYVGKGDEGQEAAGMERRKRDGRTRIAGAQAGVCRGGSSHCLCHGFGGLSGAGGERVGVGVRVRLLRGAAGSALGRGEHVGLILVLVALGRLEGQVAAVALVRAAGT